MFWKAIKLNIVEQMVYDKMYAENKIFEVKIRKNKNVNKKKRMKIDRKAKPIFKMKTNILAERKRPHNIKS